MMIAFKRMKSTGPVVSARVVENLWEKNGFAARAESRKAPCRGHNVRLHGAWNFRRRRHIAGCFRPTFPPCQPVVFRRRALHRPASARRSQNDILGFNIAVRQPLFMEKSQRLSEDESDPQTLGNGQTVVLALERAHWLDRAACTRPDSFPNRKIERLQDP